MKNTHSYSSGGVMTTLLIVTFVAVVVGLTISYFVFSKPLWIPVSNTKLSPSPTDVAEDPDEKNMIKREDELVEQFPEFPVYPGAEIHESAARVETRNTSKDLRAEWIVKDSVIDVMGWYVADLPKHGWVVEPPNDPLAEGEQIAHISKGALSGYIAVEDEGEQATEIVVDLKDASN